MSTIINYFPVTDLISSSAQPFADQFQLIAKMGFEVVINLSTPGSENAISDEAEIVEALGLIYVHIPIPWEAPSLAHFCSFAKAMQKFEGKKIWVHCDMNMSASCLLYLYRRKYLGVERSRAIYPMRQIWQPDGPWQDLVEKVLAPDAVAY